MPTVVNVFEDERTSEDEMAEQENSYESLGTRSASSANLISSASTNTISQIYLHPRFSETSRSCSHARERSSHRRHKRRPRRHSEGLAEQKLKRQRKNNPCIVALAVISVFLSLVAIGLIVLQCTGFLPSASRQSVCIPCQAIVTTPFPEQDPSIHILDIQINNRTLVCCASTPHQFEVLFSKVADRKIKEKDVLAIQQADANKPIVPTKAAYLRIGAHLLAGAESTNSKPSYQFRGWMTKGPQAYIQGLHLADDKLIVQHGGLYLVYSQVFFKVKLGETKTPNELPILGHEVQRYSVTRPEGTEKLLRSAQTYGAHEKTDKMFFHTSHVSGVFKLAPREEIFVTVSHPAYIYRDPARSFFGVFKLN